MNAGVISTRYARAIYEYAAGQGAETVLHKEMRLLVKHFTEFPTLREVMNDPTVVPEQKIKVLTTACGIEVNEVLQKTVRLVVMNKRANYMESIARMYEPVYRKAKGMVAVRLTTVEPAGEKIKEELTPVIVKETRKNVDFQTVADPDIIGGFILEIEDKRLDASVKDQLNKLKQNARY